MIIHCIIMAMRVFQFHLFPHFESIFRQIQNLLRIILLVILLFYIFYLTNWWTDEHLK